MNFTPGPWKVETETETDDVGISVTFVTGIDPIAGYIEMAGLQDEQLANARLIAAAPDLLEACKELLGEVENTTFTNTEGYYRGLIIGRAKAAIAKATEE